MLSPFALSQITGKEITDYSTNIWQYQQILRLTVFTENAVLS